MDSHRIAWLAGLYDGDGCFAMDNSYQQSLGHKRLLPKVHLITTCRKTHQRVMEILHELSVGVHVVHRENPQPSKVGKYNSWAPRWDIVVAGMKRVRTLLPHVLPHLVTKYEEAKLLREFIESRMSGSLRGPYTEREHEIHVAVGALKTKRHLS